MRVSCSKTLQSATALVFAAFLAGNLLWCQQSTQSSAGPTRTEKDLLGEKQVPANAYYGVQTLRALENFQLSGVPINHYPASWRRGPTLSSRRRRLTTMPVR